MIRKIRRSIMEHIPVIKIFNKLGGIDYAIHDRSDVVEGAKQLDYFVMDGIKYKVDGYANITVTSDRFEYDIFDIKPDDVVLDIGTTVGDFTIAASKRAKSVYAVEPLFYEELESNLKLNNCSNVVVLKFAIGNGEIVDLSFNKKEQKDVVTHTLSDIIKMIRFYSNEEVTFIKCDIEGYEWFINPSDFDGVRRIEMEIHPKMFPTESYNPNLIPYIKEHWDTTFTHEDRPAYVLHAKPKVV